MLLGKNIRYLRGKNNMTMEQLADKLGLKSFSTISGWETGRREPPFAQIEQIADIFRVTVDKLMSSDIEKEEESLKYVDVETLRLAKRIVENPKLRQCMELLDVLENYSAGEIERVIHILTKCGEFIK